MRIFHIFYSRTHVDIYRTLLTWILSMKTVTHKGIGCLSAHWIKQLHPTPWKVEACTNKIFSGNKPCQLWTIAPHFGGPHQSSGEWPLTTDDVYVHGHHHLSNLHECLSLYHSSVSLFWQPIKNVCTDSSLYFNLSIATFTWSDVETVCGWWKFCGF
jgi:hypothetical protein